MSNYTKLLYLNNNLKDQCGQALLAMLVILVFGLSAAIYTLVRPTSSAVERDKITAAALAQAKAALIGYAAGVGNLAGGERPGDLPCPDINDSGGFGSSCNTQATRIGRLPWKRLGLPDLRDGDGERLWYAVSDNFKKDTRTTCPAPGATGCLNSDSRGTITIRNSEGVVINKGLDPDPMGIDPTPYAPSGIIAVIFAPGGALQRQDGISQIRDCSGAGCVVATGVCNSTATAKCNPVNYLDILNGVEDNADFIDGNNANGFINGKIKSASGNVIVNDHLITITYQDLMPLLQRRVAKEAMNCLTAYASANKGRYPWAVPLGDYPSFADQTDTRFGRIPDGPFSATFLGLGDTISTLVCQTLGLTALCMQSNWPGASCSLSQGTWWNNWKDMVFYGVANASKPSNPISALLGFPASSGCVGSDCLLIDPPSSTANKRVVVIVAGKRLSNAPLPNGYPAGNNQPRTTTPNKRDPLNYLEGENGNNNASSYIYADESTSPSFNDFLLYQ